MTPSKSTAAAELLGRLLLATIFIASGVSKITGYAGTVQYMQNFGVPAALLPLAIVTELAGGILLVIGWQTRLAAFALIGYTLLSAVLFHGNVADQAQLIHFMKNLAISGGLFVVLAHGAGRWSLDGRRA